VEWAVGKNARYSQKHITDRVKEVFQKEGIEIPFPKRDIYIKKSE